MKNASVADRLRYQFDNFMSKGTIALIVGLAVASFAIIFLISLVVWITHAADFSFGELMWMALLRTLDSGTMGGDSGTPQFLGGMLAVTFGGIFIISALIGIINNGIEDKLDELRKGRSNVIESGHTVILGWSPQVFSIISELAIANANQRRPRIVVLGAEDKVEMEDAIHDRVPKLGRTRVVCRTGSPIDLDDLDMVSLQTSKSVIVLSPEGDDPDTHVIKTMLAITNGPNRRPGPYHIVAEIHDPRNMDAARMVGRDEVELVLVGGLISRITVQTCRQSGLSVVYTELLDFGGDEIYFKTEPTLAGKTYGESLSAYDRSSVMGLSFADGRVQLNPPMGTVLATGDEIIAISEDDDTIVLSGRKDHAVNAAAIRRAALPAPQPERTLILGWNWRVPTILHELDHYVAPVSAVTVVADFPDGEAEIAAHCPDLAHQTVGYQLGDTTDRRTLDSLAIPTYQHVIILCSDALEEQKADARTLITLLHLRDIADRTGHSFSIVSEMLDIRNRTLAEVTRPDDFIVSEKLVSLMLSQISENKRLNAVFGDMFDPEGSEIYLKPVTHYVAVGRPLNFYTVLEAARQQGETAIGYRIRANAADAARAYGVVVNPAKAEPVTFAEGDKIIVIAEN
ncbi:MAG: potassium transporter TrkA [Chloroflexi bacterium]|nr:potassium transporter TrkA [Chloroflexota bacterium]